MQAAGWAVAERAEAGTAPVAEEVADEEVECDAHALAASEMPTAGMVEEEVVATGRHIAQFALCLPCTLDRHRAAARTEQTRVYHLANSSCRCHCSRRARC